jgi:hypothetical protein
MVCGGGSGKHGGLQKCSFTQCRKRDATCRSVGSGQGGAYDQWRGGRRPSRSCSLPDKSGAGGGDAHLIVAALQRLCCPARKRRTCAGASAAHEPFKATWTGRNPALNRRGFLPDTTVAAPVVIAAEGGVRFCRSSTARTRCQERGSKGAGGCRDSRESSGVDVPSDVRGGHSQYFG